MVLYAQVAAAYRDVAATRRRSEKVRRLADTLREAGPEELTIVVAHLSGSLPQGRIGVGHATLRDLEVAPAAEPSLSVVEVDAVLESVGQVSGPGSQGARVRLLEELLGRATGPEQDLLRGVLAGEIRQGALAGVMTEAVALAFDSTASEVRRAAMLAGDLGAVAVTAAVEGDAGLARYRLCLFQPLQPMLASAAPSAAEAVTSVGDAIVDWKLDGARVQVHYDGTTVRVFTRNLREVTARLPGTTHLVGSLPVATAVLDAEVIGLGGDGRPRPFQETMSRFGREGLDDARRSTLRTFVFDALHLDGDDLIDLPLVDRLERLGAVLPGDASIPRIRTSDGEEAERFLADAVAAGHEGVMVKAAQSRYAAGRRGAEWLKVKPTHTLDLVVVAAEWGSGRRRGWLSNLHLAAYDASEDRFVMLGKTFKGLTDSMLQWQTERFLELETHREGHVVHVRPEQVVEIAFDGIQRSTRYPGGMALRFARVKGYREDKRAADADTIDTVRAILEGSRS